MHAEFPFWVARIPWFYVGENTYYVNFHPSVLQAKWFAFQWQIPIEPQLRHLDLKLEFQTGENALQVPSSDFLTGILSEVLLALVKGGPCFFFLTVVRTTSPNPDQSHRCWRLSQSSSIKWLDCSVAESQLHIHRHTHRQTHMHTFVFPYL